MVWCGYTASLLVCLGGCQPPASPSMIAPSLTPDNFYHTQCSAVQLIYLFIFYLCYFTFTFSPPVFPPEGGCPKPVVDHSIQSPGKVRPPPGWCCIVWGKDSDEAWQDLVAGE
eukprot:EG_transcript_46869